MISFYFKIRFLLARWRVVYFYLFRIFPIVRNRIVFCNFNGKGYGDNPKAIAEHLLEFPEDFDLVWLISKENASSLPNKIRAVKIDSLRAIYELATARVWIDNNRKPFVVRKRKKQFYIQTWHGNNMLKKIEKDSATTLSYNYLLNAINDSKMIDLCISNSSFFSNFLKNSFWFEGKIIESGLPKSDRLLNHSINEVDIIKDRIGINASTLVLLYAPTFREDHSTDAYIKKFGSIINELKTKFGKSFKLLVRLHPALNNTLLNIDCDLLNVSDYPDIQDLVIISDVLITDYSSLMFDFGMLGKPVFLFMNDIHKYKYERGFYFDINALPFYTSESMNGLINAINSFNAETYNRTLAYFNSFVLELKETGSASDKISEVIRSVIHS